MKWEHNGMTISEVTDHGMNDQWPSIENWKHNEAWISTIQCQQEQH